MQKFLSSICLLLILILPLSVSSHPGRTDKYGGHTEKATGQYHIHNDDGTITYTTKPVENTQPKQPVAQPPAQTEQAPAQQVPQTNTTESIPVAPVVEQPSTPSAPASEAVPSTSAPELPEQPQPVQPEPALQEETPPVVNVNETTATIGETTKPLQPEVAENANLQNNSNAQTTPTGVTTTIYKYNTSQPNDGISLNIFLIILLCFFAFIGICMVSAVVHHSLKKIEGKSQNIDFLLYIPFIIVIIPAILGDLLFKAYINLLEKSPPNPRQQSAKKDDFI